MWSLECLKCLILCGLKDEHLKSSASQECIIPMADLGIFGLAVGAFLFLLPCAIYLTFGLRCSNYTSELPAEKISNLCKNVNSEMALTLSVFGVIFLVCGLTMCGFTAFIWLRERSPTEARTESLEGQTQDERSWI